MFKLVKRYYDLGLYSKENVKAFVVANRISAEDYKLITGDEYTA